MFGSERDGAALAERAAGEARPTSHMDRLVSEIEQITAMAMGTEKRAQEVGGMLADLGNRVFGSAPTSSGGQDSANRVIGGAPDAADPDSAFARLAIRLQLLANQVERIDITIANNREVAKRLQEIA